MAEPSYRQQTVDFLGFLRSQLNGLQGIPTLCYELIQNADDVKNERGESGASRITFDVCDDALWVENDGVFREIDFERMQRLSWGNKREEVGTTGAFGIGFISVYQITDAPELFSSGRHWTFQPAKSETKRIKEEHVETSQTRFRLPWAFDVSETRKELGIPPVSRDMLDDYAGQIQDSIRKAALFLKQIRTLEVKRNGHLLCRLETVREDNQLLLQEGGEVVAWQILEGDFESQTIEIRRRAGDMIEKKRRASVQVAVSEDPSLDGLLYAFLPSEVKTGLPFHINADFYPTPDRKRILFGEDFKSEWNRLALNCAAQVLAKNLPVLQKLFSSNKDLWEFAERVNQAGKQEALYRQFWVQLKPILAHSPTVLTVSETLLQPEATRYPDSDAQQKASQALDDSGVSIVHAELRPYRNLLLETGAKLLTLADIQQAFADKDWCKRVERSSMPASLQSDSDWNDFWEMLNDLSGKQSGSRQQESDNSLKRCAIAFGADGALWPPEELFFADEETQSLFGGLAPVPWLDAKGVGADKLPSRLTRSFDLEKAVEILESSLQVIHQDWRDKRFNPAALYDWLQKQRRSINPTLIERLRNCPIWPAADGSLRSLTDLYLPADFKDPLHLAQFVDAQALGGEEFLEKTLNVRRLDFATYAQDWIPNAFHSLPLTCKQKMDVLRALAENLGKLQENEAARKNLSRLELIWCGGEKFVLAEKAYFDTEEIRQTLAELHPIARLADGFQGACRALYEWLGVASAPRPKHLLERIQQIVSEPVSSENVKIIGQIIAYLATLSSWDEFEELQRLAWLPGAKREEWFSPSEVYSIFRSYLFESVGNFLQIDRQIQQKANDFLKFLGVQSEPNVKQVVQHLLYLCQHKSPKNINEIYRFLNESQTPEELAKLKDTACLYLQLSSGENIFARPDQVFWDEHPFGDYRYRLSPDFGSLRNLLDNLGVKSRPDAQDAIQVLLELAAKFGSSNQFLDQHTETVVWECWKLLGRALESGDLSKDDLQKRLGQAKVIPDSRLILEPPSHLFIEDRANWGKKFEILKHSLVKRVEGAIAAMEAAGVQRISAAVETNMHKCDEQTPDEFLPRRLQERAPFFSRIVQANCEKLPGKFLLEKLQEITYVRAQSIEITRTFKGYLRPETVHEAVNAVCLENTLYFTADNGKLPWIEIASELASVIYPEDSIPDLALAIKEAIEHDTLEETEYVFDQLGYPPPTVNIQSLEAPSQTVTFASDADVMDEDRFPDAEFSRPARGEEPKEKTALRMSASSDTKSSPFLPKAERSTRRMVSYVYPESEKAEQMEKSASRQEHRQQIAQLGVDIVMEFERRSGRRPTDMETIQTNHEGYDIESIDSDGRVRYIEVKALSGQWSSPNPVQMTRAEFKHAQKLGEDYWLYVIENTTTDNPQIHPIQNPAGQIDYYLFDHQWILLETN